MRAFWSVSLSLPVYIVCVVDKMYFHKLSFDKHGVTEVSVSREVGATSGFVRSVKPRLAENTASFVK